MCILYVVHVYITCDQCSDACDNVCVGVSHDMTTISTLWPGLLMVVVYW